MPSALCGLYSSYSIYFFRLVCGAFCICASVNVSRPHTMIHHFTNTLTGSGAILGVAENSICVRFPPAPLRRAYANITMQGSCTRLYGICIYCNVNCKIPVKVGRGRASGYRKHMEFPNGVRPKGFGVGFYMRLRYPACPPLALFTEIIHLLNRSKCRSPVF